MEIWLVAILSITALFVVSLIWLLFVFFIYEEMTKDLTEEEKEEYDREACRHLAEFEKERNTFYKGDIHG